MSGSIQLEYRGRLALFRYNGAECFRDIVRFYKGLEADNKELIDASIEAFSDAIEATVFAPAQQLIDSAVCTESSSFLQAIVAITNPMPEILGAATDGFVDTGKNHGAGARYRKGLATYILPDVSPYELIKVDFIHYNQVRNALSHSFIVSNVWLERDGKSQYVSSEEVYDSISKNKDMFDNHEAVLNHLRDHPHKYATVNVVDWNNKVRIGFERYIAALRGGDGELRDNFMKYVTQFEDWEKL